jgi:tryptophan synthase
MAQRFRKQILFVYNLQHDPQTVFLHVLQQALKNGVTVTSTLEMVRQARKKGLRAPVLFMGYYNPILSYGEEKLLKDCREAGVNGFIVVDLPPEEAVTFRNWCAKGG